MVRQIRNGTIIYNADMGQAQLVQQLLREESIVNPGIVRKSEFYV